MGLSRARVGRSQGTGLNYTRVGGSPIMGLEWEWDRNLLE